MSQAICLTKSCTTGWLNWIHGDLWLLPERGLLRIPGSLLATLAHGVWPTIDPLDRPCKTISVREARQLAAADPRTMWLPKNKIARAAWKRGPITSVLCLELTDGHSLRLMSARCDRAEEILAPVLNNWCAATATS